MKFACLNYNWRKTGIMAAGEVVAPPAGGKNKRLLGVGFCATKHDIRIQGSGSGSRVAHFDACIPYISFLVHLPLFIIIWYRLFDGFRWIKYLDSNNQVQWYVRDITLMVLLFVMFGFEIGPIKSSYTRFPHNIVYKII